MRIFFTTFGFIAAYISPTLTELPRMKLLSDNSPSPSVFAALLYCSMSFSMSWKEPVIVTMS